MQLHAGKGNPPLVTAKLIAAGFHDTVRTRTHCHVQCLFIKVRDMGLWYLASHPSLLKILSRVVPAPHLAYLCPAMREAIGSHPSQPATTSCHGGLV